MRRRLVIALRVLETLLLVGVVYAFHRFAGQQMGTFYFGHFTMAFSVTLHAPAVVLSSTVLGYVVSQVATMLTPPESGPRFFRWSLLLSLLGIVSFGLEVVRFFVGYEVSVLIQGGAILVVIDWMLTRGMLALPPEESKEESSQEDKGVPVEPIAAGEDKDVLAKESES